MIMCWWNESTRAVSARIGRAHHCVCVDGRGSPLRRVSRLSHGGRPSVRAPLLLTHTTLPIYICCSSLCCRLFPPRRNLKKGWGSLPPPKKRIRSLSISCPGWQAPFLFSAHLPSSSARAHLYTHTSHALPFFFFFFFFSLVEMDADGRAFLYFGYKEMDRETPPRHLV